MDDKRIGHGITFPETTIKGAAYTRPASTIGLGNGYFAVKDTHGNTEEEIAELIALVDNLNKSSKRKQKVSDDVQTEDS